MSTSASSEPLRATGRATGGGHGDGGTGSNPRAQGSVGPLTGLAVLLALVGALLVQLTPLDAVGIGVRVLALVVALVAVVLGARARSWRTLAMPALVVVLITVNLVASLGG